MYCKKCNKELPDDSLFCPYCGEETSDANKASMENICPACKKEIPDDSEFCPFCGAEINAIPNRNMCNKCGNEIPEDSDFCPFCGEKVVSKSNEGHAKKNINPVVYIGPKGITEKVPLKEKLASYKKTIVIIGSSVVALAIVVGIVLAIVSNNNKSTKQYQESTHYISSTYAANAKTNKYETETEYSYRPSFEEVLSEYRANKSTTEQYDYDYDYYDDEDDDEYYYSTTKPTTTKTFTTTTTTTKTTKAAPFKTLSYSGSGTNTITGINLPTGDYYIVFTTYSDLYFSAFYYDGSASYSQGSVSISGKGSEVCKVDGNVTNGYINISASDGKWTVEIIQCNPVINKSYAGKTYTGFGSHAIYQIDIPKGDYFIVFESEDENGYFSAFYYDGTASYSQDSVSISNSGQQSIKITGPIRNGYINISSTGPWKVTIKPA